MPFAVACNACQVCQCHGCYVVLTLGYRHVESLSQELRHLAVRCCIIPCSGDLYYVGYAHVYVGEVFLDVVVLGYLLCLEQILVCLAEVVVAGHVDYAYICHCRRSQAYGVAVGRRSIVAVGYGRIVYQCAVVLAALHILVCAVEQLFSVYVAQPSELAVNA